MIRLIASLLVLINASVMAAERVDAVLAFKERAVIDGTEIQLQHIAEVRGEDPALMTRLRELHVSHAPRSGLQRLVPREHALQAITQARLSVSLKAEGALQTVVEVQANDLRGERLYEAARAYLAQHLRDENPLLTRVEITAVGAAPDLRVPPGEIALVPRIQGSGFGKRVCLWLDIRIDGESYRRIPVWLGVKTYAPVLVAQRPIMPREQVDALDFVREEWDIAALRGVAAPDIATTGKRARTFIATGAALRAEDLEPTPAVLADQEVDVRVAIGPISIETKAVAEEEGRVGEYIQVRNPSSASIFTARVVGDKSVLVTAR